MTGKQFQQRRERLGLSQSQMARRLPVKLKTLQGWEHKYKSRELPSYLETALKLVESELKA